MALHANLPVTFSTDGLRRAAVSKFKYTEARLTGVAARRVASAVGQGPQTFMAGVSTRPSGATLSVTGPSG